VNSKVTAYETARQFTIRVAVARCLVPLLGVEVGLFPNVEKGEVLVDSRGEGSFQRR